MQVLHQLPHLKDENLMVGIETSDDAGVYKISPELAVISTMDFFPPIVDDPVTFGEIAAANAMSDVYAMGGEPRLALNIVGFPKKLPLGVLREIIEGAMGKLAEAGTLLVGGHSVEDSEVKYGLSVTGFVHPEKVVTNRGARPGDALVLTKPLGTGVITSAMKAGKLGHLDGEPAVESMRALNRAASEVMVELGVNACTDVTGYGLVGHAVEMARGSEATIVLRAGDVPVFDHAEKFVMKRSTRPRTLLETREHLAPDVEVAGGVGEARELVFYDPQTSGGLLVSLPSGRAGAYIEKLAARGVRGVEIGRVEEYRGKRVLIE